MFGRFGIPTTERTVLLSHTPHDRSPPDLSFSKHSSPENQATPRWDRLPRTEGSLPPAKQFRQSPRRPSRGLHPIWVRGLHKVSSSSRLGNSGLDQSEAALSLLGLLENNGGTGFSPRVSCGILCMTRRDTNGGASDWIAGLTIDRSNEIKVELRRLYFK